MTLTKNALIAVPFFPTDCGRNKWKWVYFFKYSFRLI